LFWTEVLLLVFSVYCAFVHCINDTRVFEYDRLICVTLRQTEQQNICRRGRWSGRFSPHPAPFPVRGPPLTLRSALFFWDPLTAPPEFWPAPLHFPFCSHALDSKLTSHAILSVTTQYVFRPMVDILSTWCELGGHTQYSMTLSKLQVTE